MANVRVLQLAVGLLVIFVMPVLGFDPMAPPGTAPIKDSGKNFQKIDKKPKVQGYVLRQIVIHKSVKSAVINGYIVNEGSTIHNAYVQSIKENSVVLNVLGKRREIILESKLPKIRR